MSEEINVEVAENKKSSKKGTVITALCIALSCLIILGCAAHFATPYLKKDSTAEIPAEEGAPTLYINPFEFALSPIYKNTVYPENINEDFKALYSLCNDTVGWLSIPNLNVDFPVFQAKNNDYYLRTNIFGVYDRHGVPFADYRCIFNPDGTLSKNTVIYGHHFENVQLTFANLLDYKTIEGYQDSPVITFNTIYGNYKWKVFATFTTSALASGDNGYIFNYFCPNMNEASTSGYLEEVKKRQFYFTNVDVLPTDNFLTLSTCCYDYNYSGKVIKARMVIVARLLRDGESEEVDTSNLTYNTNRYEPQAYYDMFGKQSPWPSQTWKPVVDVVS